MAIEKPGEGGAETDAGHAAVLAVGGFMDNIKGFELSMIRITVRFGRFVPR